MAEGVSLLDHMRTMLATARSQGFRVFIVPHHQTTPSAYVTWDGSNAWANERADEPPCNWGCSRQKPGRLVRR